MLVRGLIGPYAGRIVDMRFDDVLRAEANASVIRLTPDEAARHAAGPDEEAVEQAAEVPVEKVKPVVAPVPVQEKRRPGRPKGVHTRPEILA